LSRPPDIGDRSAAAPARAISETTAQRLLLVRAAERAGERGPLTRTDLHWAEQASAAASAGAASALPSAGALSAMPLALQRAELLCERLFDRDPSLPRWLAALRWPPWVGPAVIAGAALAGLASDAVGPAGRINLLAAPMLGVLAWNLAVIVSMSAAWARRALRTARQGAVPSPRTPPHSAQPLPGRLPFGVAPLNGRGAWLAHWVERAVHWRAGARSGGSAGSTRHPGNDWRTGFAADWLSAAAPLTRARASGLLHGAAAVLAGSMLVGLYLRGLAFEYRAGWESTFLDAHAVHALLGTVLGPASALSGIAVPDAQQLAQLRFDRGPGENAGPWIHLLAITIALFAVVPRALMAVAAARTVRHLRADFPLPDPSLAQDPDTSHGDGAGQYVLAIPCGWRMSEAALRALTLELRRQAGSLAQLDVAPGVAPEQADDPQGLPVLAAASRVIVVFNLSATPERETHGRFLLALQRRMTRGVPLEAWIDETAFASRFAGQPQRLVERHAAWLDLLREYTLPARFMHLEPPP